MILKKESCSATQVYILNIVLLTFSDEELDLEFHGNHDDIEGGLSGYDSRERSEHDDDNLRDGCDDIDALEDAEEYSEEEWELDRLRAISSIVFVFSV